MYNPQFKQKYLTSSFYHQTVLILTLSESQQYSEIKYFFRPTKMRKNNMNLFTKNERFCLEVLHYLTDIYIYILMLKKMLMHLATYNNLNYY